jgi:predicted nucleotidyltransferase
MTYEELIRRAEADPAVLGVILTGSVARGMATEHSDADVIVVVPERGGQWTESTHTADLDTIVVSLADLSNVVDRWERYVFRGARVLLDRLDGRIAALVAAQATLTAAEAQTWVRADLDGYINFAYRAAKNDRDGRHDLARLEDIESVPWLLWTLFALYGRVRPYNKYLRWELETLPLPAPWTAGYLIPALLDRPAALFPELEEVARAKGFGDVVDGWHAEDLELVRSRAQAGRSASRRTPAAS